MGPSFAPALAMAFWNPLTTSTSLFRSGQAVLIRPFRMVSPDASQRQDGEILAQVVLARLTALVSLLASERPQTLLCSGAWAKEGQSPSCEGVSGKHTASIPARRKRC